MTSSNKITLLIFTCPKPFIEQFIDIQCNAINSWKRLYNTDVTVIIHLLGNEQGVGEHAKQLNCNHIPDIKKNKFGTPLIDDIFSTIKKVAFEYRENGNVVCCYINTDIILFNEMLDNIISFSTVKTQSQLKKDCSYADPNKYLLIGTRWDTSNVPKIDFNDTEWENKIKTYALKNGESHGCWGIDYFIFCPTTFNYIYPFAVGKFVWDRWLVGNVFRQDSITVDITKTNFVIHQNCDWYQKSTGGITNNRKALFDTEEVKINQSFDYYEKDISSGTQWETMYCNLNGTDNCQKEIQYIYKQFIPRKD